MTLYRKLLSTAERFNRDRTGVVAVIFALLLLPLIGLVGLATDYGMARASQGRLQATADAAALAGARAARTVLSETGGTQAEAIDAANSHANSYMMKVTSEGRGITIDSSVASFQVKNGEIIGTLKFTARSKANFAPLFGVPSLQIGGTAEARADLPRYVDTYLLLDNSASMGLAATDADASKLRLATTQLATAEDRDCQFACHRAVSPYPSNYDIARNYNVRLRIDVLRDTVLAGIQAARAGTKMPNQFRFEVNTFDRTLASIMPLTSNLSTLESRVTSDVSLSHDDLEANTFIDDAVTSLTDHVPTGGDGTSVATRQKLVILVTDGVSDESPAGSMSERNYLRPMRSAAMQSWKCDALKQKNVRVVVVETFYIPIVTGNGSGFYNYLVKPWEGSISTALKGCASPGVDNYFQASSAADIEAAMAKVFASVVNPLRLTN